MSTDPFGPESPFGDAPKNPESSPNEDFLGLGGGLNEPDPPRALEEEIPDAPILNDPTNDELQIDDEMASVDLDEFAASLDAKFDGDGSFGDDTLEEVTFSNDPSPVEPLADLQPLDGQENFDTEETFDPEVGLDQPSEEFTEASSEAEVEHEDGWLMEFEIDEDAFEGDVFSGDESTSDPLVDEGGDGASDFDGDEYEEELVPSLQPTGSPWLGRALIAAVSVFFGVIGSKFIPFGNEAPPEIKPRIAQVTRETTPEQPNETTTPVEAVDETPTTVTETPTPTVDIETPVESVVTATENPTPAENGEVNPDGTPQIEIDWQGNQQTTGWGRGQNGAGNSADQVPLTPDELGMRLREASPSELSRMWLGAAIPMEAIASTDRVLTPNVGRVRVILADGEIFEGKLYAVGEKRVWIETTLGKMALLDWQIDRVEHIISSEGTAVLGEDGSQDLAGLKSVRVSTAGGVFYGKLISQDDDVVTLVTKSGGRITLRDAKVDSAGRSATHLVDSTGAVEDPELDEEE